MLLFPSQKSKCHILGGVLAELLLNQFLPVLFIIMWFLFLSDGSVTVRWCRQLPTVWCLAYSYEELRTFRKCFRWTQFLSNLTLSNVFPSLVIYSMLVILIFVYMFLSLSLCLLPWINSKTFFFYTVLSSFLSVCPTHFHFAFFKISIVIYFLFAI